MGLETISNRNATLYYGETFPSISRIYLRFRRLRTSGSERFQYCSNLLSSEVAEPYQNIKIRIRNDD
jgi:hypothetical protein